MLVKTAENLKMQKQKKNMRQEEFVLYRYIQLLCLLIVN